MLGKFRYIGISCLLIGAVLILFSCVSTPAVKPSEASPNKGTGKLLTIDSFKFHYEFYPSNTKSPTVIYIPGIGGTSGPAGPSLAPSLNKSNFNFIVFDYADPPPNPGEKEETLKYLNKQRNSRSSMFPAAGINSAAQNILQNEISSIIEFIERAPTHDQDKGIYLIGGSYGSWLSLLTVQAYPDKIKGVVFLSPAITPEIVKPKSIPKRYDGTRYFKTLTDSFGNRPALAIGGKDDIIAPFMNKTESALDAANLLRENIGPNVEIMEVSTDAHSKALLEESRKVREKIVMWLIEKERGK